MTPIDVLLRVALLPAAVCAAAALLGWVVARRSTRGRDAILGVGVAAAFIAAMFALEMGPSLPLKSHEDGWLWIVWISAVGAIVGVLETFVSFPRVGKALIRSAFGLALVWLLCRPIQRFHSDRSPREWAEILVPVTALLWLWSVLADGRPRASRLSSVGPILIAVLAAAAIQAFYGHSYQFGMAAGAFGVAIAATAALGLPRQGSPLLPTSAAAVVAPVFVAILVASHVYLNYGETTNVPVAASLLLFASAACCGVRSWRVASILALLLAGGAAVVAAVHAGQHGPSTYGW